jgi:RHS repeat-associated protein
LTTQYAYNGDGLRTSKTVDGISTQYVLDLATTLPVVISDTDAIYLYGLDIIAEQQTEMLYYMHDGLGSVRQLLDSAGNVETSYAYDPFGVPLAGGDVYNPYRYTGEACDEEVELLYLRARYYQPEVGRFITKDPSPGDLLRPLSLNAWVYAANNPVNLADPTGLREWKRSSSRFERMAERLYATSRPDINFIHLEPAIAVPWGSFAFPDVLNSWTGDVYEVEPLPLLPVAFAEAVYYRDVLTSAGGGGYNFRGQPVTGYQVLPRSDPNDWNLTTWLPGPPFPQIRRTGVFHTAYGPETVPPGFDFVVMSPGGGAMLWWLEPRPETVAGACFVLAGGIIVADLVENIASGGVGLVDEPVVVVSAGVLIVIGESIQSADAPLMGD